MGEIADLMINGDICEQCGCELGPGDGFARVCSGCGGSSVGGEWRGPADGSDILKQAKKNGWAHTVHNNGYHWQFRRGTQEVNVWLRGDGRRKWLLNGMRGKASHNIQALFDTLAVKA